MRQFNFILVLMLFLGLSSGWGLGQREQQSAQILTIAVPRTISSAPLLVLGGKTLESNQIQVNIYDDHPLALAEFLAGRSDVLLTGYQLGLSRWHADQGVRHLATVVWGVSSILTKNLPQEGLEALRGKTILVPFAGSPLEVQLKALLKSANLLDTVTIDYSPITQMPALLLQGRTDAIAVPEPIVSRLVLQNQARILMNFATEWERLTGDARSPQVSLFVKSSELSQRLKVFQTLRDAVRQKLTQGYTDQELTLLAQRLEIPVELAKKALASTLFSLPDNATQYRLLETYHRYVADNLAPKSEFLVP
jgi:NitT/TauT family transport system substrate-binding protein